MQCPECDASLSTRDFAGEKIAFCDTCRGFWLENSRIKPLFNSLSNNKAFMDKYSGSSEARKTDLRDGFCPHCHMLASRVTAGDSSIPLLHCAGCNGIWVNVPNVGALTNLWLSNPEAFHQFLYAAKDAPSYFQSGDSFLKSFVGWIEDDNPTRGVPYVTYLLIAVNVLLFGAVYLGNMIPLELFLLYPDRLIEEPALNLFSLITCMFMHGSIGHLAGNLFYLYLFGDNIEDRMGWLKYLALYFGTGIIASLVFVATTANPSIPLLGASGAIAGVMGAYLALYPKVRISFHKMLFLIPYKINVPAYVLIGIYFVGMQFIGIALNIPGIAWSVHLAGLVLGYASAFIMKKADWL